MNVSSEGRFYGQEQKHTLLVGIERLGKNVVSSENHNDWEILVNKSENSVFEFARHDGLAVEIGDLFDLQGT